MRPAIAIIALVVTAFISFPAFLLTYLSAALICQWGEQFENYKNNKMKKLLTIIAVTFALVLTGCEKMNFDNTVKMEMVKKPVVMVCSKCGYSAPTGAICPKCGGTMIML